MYCRLTSPMNQHLVVRNNNSWLVLIIIMMTIVEGSEDSSWLLSQSRLHPPAGHQSREDSET